MFHEGRMKSVSMKLLVCFLLLVNNHTPCVLTGCCNSNVWCDGDPEFVKTPLARSMEGSYVLVSWNESYMHLPKCVDYFYVEYKEQKDNETYALAPVYTSTKERKVEGWGEDLSNEYTSNFTALPGRVYTIRVVAVDKGSGWGELEGKAIVFSLPIVLNTTTSTMHLRAFVGEWESKYGDCPHSSSLNTTTSCASMRLEWAAIVMGELTERLGERRDNVGGVSDIDLRYGRDRRVYEQGRVSFEDVELLDVRVVNSLSVECDIGFSLLTMSYTWQSFLASGELTLYHTCDTDLPVAIFNDVDVDEVAEVVGDACRFILTIVIGDDAQSSKIPIVSSELKRKEFRYDVTWISRSMHNLPLLWRRQSVILEERMKSLVGHMAMNVLENNDFHTWKEAKWSHFHRVLQNLREEEEHSQGVEHEDAVRVKVQERSSNAHNNDTTRTSELRRYSYV